MKQHNKALRVKSNKIYTQLELNDFIKTPNVYRWRPNADLYSCIEIDIKSGIVNIILEINRESHESVTTYDLETESYRKADINQVPKDILIKLFDLISKGFLIVK